jgi:hypothetical protein
MATKRVRSTCCNAPVVLVAEETESGDWLPMYECSECGGCEMHDSACAPSTMTAGEWETAGFKVVEA